jgi:2-oxoglutarate ferredoxin oxidoreductase subunit alpha
MNIKLPPKPWAATGKAYHEGRNVINSCFVIPEEMEVVNLRLEKKYQNIRKSEQICESYMLDGAEIVLVAFGTASRLCRSVVDKARQMGIPAGLIRPVTLWPFPYDFIGDIAGKFKCMLAVEMNMGQMQEDVQLAVKGKIPVYHYGRLGGMVPVARDILEEVVKLYSGGAHR